MKVEKGYHPELDEVQYRITLSEDEAVAIGYALEDMRVDQELSGLQNGHLVATMRDQLLMEVEG